MYIFATLLIIILLAGIFFFFIPFWMLYGIIFLLIIIILILWFSRWNGARPFPESQHPKRESDPFTEKQKEDRDFTRTFVRGHIPEAYRINAAILLDAIQYEHHPESFNSHVNLTRSQLLQLLAIFFHQDKYTAFLARAELLEEQKERIRSDLADINKIIIRIIEDPRLYKAT